MNRKTGLEYFPLDVDFFQDEKIQFVSARFGTKGEAIALRLLCKIYRQGYFVDWNDDMALLFAKGVGDGCRHSCVNDVVFELLKRGFFDKSIFESFSILTGRGIQKRYFEACSKAKRKKVAYVADYMLIDLSMYASILIEASELEALPQNSEINIQNSGVLEENSGVLKGGQKTKRRQLTAGLKAELRNIRDSFVFGDDLNSAVNDWIKYKFERNQQYKPTGLQSLLARIKNNAHTCGESAMADVIRDSMANNYQGIVWDRLARFVSKEQPEYKFDS